MTETAIRPLCGTTWVVYGCRFIVFFTAQPWRKPLTTSFFPFLPSVSLFSFLPPRSNQTTGASRSVPTVCLCLGVNLSLRVDLSLIGSLSIVCVCARLLHFCPPHSATVTHFNMCTSRFLYWCFLGCRASHWSAVILSVKLGFQRLEKLPQQLVGARYLLWAEKKVKVQLG